MSNAGEKIMTKKKYNFDDHPEHKAQLKGWADMWIKNAMSTKPMEDDDRAKMRVAIKGLYEAANLTPSPVHKELGRVKAENEGLREALFDMAWQFCSRNDKLSHSFMSAEEHAFGVLGLKNGMTYEEAEKQALQQKGGGDVDDNG